MKRIKVLSLAALVAFGACDEGSEPVVPTPVTGTVSGVVTIEGTARSGVTVTLSSGATATTDGSGAYSFAGVNAGAYTVTISGFPTDATFSSTAKAATITTAGQVVTVNFDGTYVRTSAVLGSVSAGGSGLAGVKVTLGSSSVNTDANGQYAFSGLRAGSYTVTISGFDAGQYTFASTSATVTVGVGESKVVPFTGQRLATASITGTVTIDGGAAAGVTATLSTGATATTNASGTYSFSNLTAGTYTVTISGYAADAQFESVAKPVVITSAGSTVTANFAGSYIKTSSITGTVTVSGVGIGGVTVTLSSGATVNTDANGQYSFSALRAGTYTVTISGWNAATYTFATTTGTATVATGQGAVVNFTGSHVATAAISGALYIDESPSNGSYEATAEDKLAVAGIVIQAEGGAVNNTFTTTTDASGNYSFTGLTAGTYRITILGVTAAPLNAALPGNVAFRAGAATSQLVTVTVGGSGTAHWPFNITRQTIRQYVMFGVEGTSVGTNPVSGASVWLYDTYANAVAAGATGRIGTATTTSAGLASFNFARAVDVGPSGSVDNIVFARLNTLPNANYALSNAENVIEIKYVAKDSVSMSPDTMDVINNQLVVKVKAQEIDNDVLAGWTTQARFDPDTTTASLAATTNASGWVYYTINRTVITNHVAANLAFPDTITVRLQDTGQPATHGWTSTATAGVGTTTGRFVRYIWSGLNPASDTVDMGSLNVKYTSTDVIVRAHRERDDSGGAKPTYTAGDDFALITSINMQLYSVSSTGVKTSTGAAVAAGPNGGVLFTNVANGTFEARARSTDPTLTVLNDTAVAIVLDGSDEVYTDMTLVGSTSAFNSTFAVKSNNNIVNGTVLASNGVTPAAGLIVTITPDAGNIQGTAMKVDTTDAAGAYGWTGMREGPYTVTITGSSVWDFTKTLTTVTAPNASGSANNTSATVAPRDVQGSGTTVTANFEPRRIDTAIQGLIANDRDGDQNTIDPEEGLYAATVQLYKDNSGTITVSADSLVATTTTDTNGAFSFSALAEGTYIVKPVATANSVVLRGLTNGDTAIVRTGPAYTTTTTVACPATSLSNGNPDASLNNACHGRTVGINASANFSAGLPLPAWNYGNSTFNLKQSLTTHRQPHFTFLYNTGTATGIVTKTGVAVSGMTVSAVKCQTSTGYTSPPTVTNPMTGTCTPVGSPMNATTNASGTFTISGLQEGVWMVTANPATAGLADPTWSALFVILGNNDIETGNFPIP